ncbi:1581_t:CDS:1, partial [Funneliformis geosporum]
ELERGNLIFSQLKVQVKLKPGNILAFRLNLLVYGNLSCFDVKHSLVFFTHNNLFSETFQNVKNTNSFDNSSDQKKKKRKTNANRDFD